jgi:hypothetical protein
MFVDEIIALSTTQNIPLKIQKIPLFYTPEQKGKRANFSLEAP